MEVDSHMRAELAGLLTLLGNLSHQLQLERGHTALYCDDHRLIFAEAMRLQHEATDAAKSVLRAAVERAGTLQNTPCITKLTAFVRGNEKLDAHRSKVLGHAASFSRAINAYSYAFLSPIIDISVEVALQISPDHLTKVSAYANFLQWKERVGRERAWGIHGFQSKNFKSELFLNQMVTLVEEQTAYSHAFLSLAEPEQAREVESILSLYATDNLERIHEHLMQSDVSQDMKTLSAESWFELLTARINDMRRAETYLLTDLQDHAKANTAPISSVPISPKQHKFDQHMPLIRALPAFSKLEETELDTLLTHAVIRNYDKGKLLFAQGEPLTRLYLILDGWVKLFKSTDGGEETVLQMLSSGDTLMEAAVFLDVPSLVSAQVVQTTKILSIPAPIARQSLMDNNNFAMNMIGSLSVRSQSLINQIEQSRLKTATERVGWFLLRLGLEQNGGKLDTISLPYDKSTIASYLDMRPETFSRTLKKFRNKGFAIDNDQISRPDPRSLCSFCDEMLASSCVYKDQDICPQTYLS